MNIPVELLPGPFWIGIALDALLDLFDGEGGAGEGVGKGLVVFKLHVGYELVSQSFPLVQCGEEFFRYIFAHTIFLGKVTLEHISLLSMIVGVDSLPSRFQDLLQHPQKITTQNLSDLYFFKPSLQQSVCQVQEVFLVFKLWE